MIIYADSDWQRIIPYCSIIFFGYDGDNIYLHTARKGWKIDFIESNNSVCFEFEDSVKIVPNENALCSFKSVIGYGLIEEIKGKDKKIET